MLHKENIPNSDVKDNQMLHKENIPNSDVKDIASNRTGYCHVSKTFLGHDDTGYKIRYTGSCCQDGQPHDL